MAAPKFRFPYRIADIARLWPEMATARNRGVGRWEQMIALLERRDQAVEDWIGSFGQGGGKEYATVVIAANDTHQSGKDSADFVCDGVDDHLTFQDAVDSLPNGWAGIKQGRIVLLEGFYNGSGDLNLEDASVVFEGQRLTGTYPSTVMVGINLVSTLRGEATIDGIYWFGDIDLNGVSTLLMHNTRFNGSIITPALDVRDSELSITSTAAVNEGGFWVNNSTLSGTFTGTNLGSLLWSDVILAGTLTASALGPETETDFNKVKLVFLGANNASVHLTNFKEGDLDLSSDSFLPNGPTLRLTNTENLVVRGRFGTLDTAQPQILIEESAGTSSRNTLRDIVFEGNNENSGGVGSTTCHVQIGSGVANTKLVDNTYGGASSGNVCDSGTNTISVDPTTPLSSGGEAALFWMGAGHRQPHRTPDSTPAAADETLSWMLGGVGPRGAKGDTGATGATGSSGDEGLIWMGAGHRHGTPGRLKTPARWASVGTDIILNSTSWANMPTFGTLTIPANVGDLLKVHFNVHHSNEAVAALIDAVTEVSGTPTTSFTTGGAAPTGTTGVGVAGWRCDLSDDGAHGGDAYYVVQSGDIVSGAVTIRLRYRTGSAANKTLAGTASVMFFSVENLGIQ